MKKVTMAITTLITPDGDRIITHGVPAGWGYIKDGLGHYLPVLLHPDSYEIVREDGFIVNTIASRKECIDYIKHLIDHMTVVDSAEEK